MRCFGIPTDMSPAALLNVLQDIPVDSIHRAPENWRPPKGLTTLAKPISVSGKGTYDCRRQCTMEFRPVTDFEKQPAWSIVRTDRAGCDPIPITVPCVRDTKRNIEVQHGEARNNVRMVEHIIAQRFGLWLDAVEIGIDSDDPPLFDWGSIPLIQSLQEAGIREIPGTTASWWTVREPVLFTEPSSASPNDFAFLYLEPAPQDAVPSLSLDVIINFPTAIGCQRIQFDLTPEIFRYGAQARTNCSRLEYFLLKTLGRCTSKWCHTGYTTQNILIAGKRHYANQPILVEHGKSLEAVWHRACLDLVAALALFPYGRLAGKITSFMSGHAMDCHCMQTLLREDLFAQLP